MVEMTAPLMDQAVLKPKNATKIPVQFMEDGENLVNGRHVQFLVEAENRQEFVYATAQLLHMVEMTAPLMDQAVLKPKIATKIPVQSMEDGENLVNGRNVQFLVEVENRKEFVRATALLLHMVEMTAPLMDQAVLNPENVTKIPVQFTS